MTVISIIERPLDGNCTSITFQLGRQSRHPTPARCATKRATPKGGRRRLEDTSDQKRMMPPTVKNCESEIEFDLPVTTFVVAFISVTSCS